MPYYRSNRSAYRSRGAVGTRSVFTEKMAMTQSIATATWADEEWKMPVSKTGGIIMAIHQIEYSAMYDTTHFTSLPTGDGKYIHIQLTREEESAVIDEDDDDLIDFVKIDQNMTTSGEFQTHWPVIHKFYPPIAQARNVLHVSCQHNFGFTAKVTVRIRYTLVKVSQDQLVSRLINEEE